ncbi:agmatine deiminase family protein [Thalassotalea sp. LPB0316]|uniref:agmatine deiminase family protein n=1 Tax=Thalassotalea sp. LPB0316 TaxID=2769490 RepID=UPI001865D639|nr:agmatine deiminase family protein [Thalassotalea sp. LPB0316]QOL24474.1 agmatine deiminase family protein [Thalassotalea sp. LPB0316]
MNSRHFSLPAEWAEQDAVMLTWPHPDTDWQPILTKVEPVFVEICQAILRFERLVIVCHNQAIKAHVINLLEQVNADTNRVTFIIAPTNDTWARDHGPITLSSGNQIKALDFTFNGWGNKFDAALDNQINSALFSSPSFNHIERKTIDLVLEGGGIESDGQGHLLTTAQCIFNQNRNPQLAKEELTTRLLTLLGLNKALILNHGDLIGDDTDAHIDTLCRFAPNNQIVYTQCDRQEDAHYQDLAKMEAELKTFRQINGQPFKLVPLPLPEAKFDASGDRLPATYANFLIINNAVLVPVYQDINDTLAVSQMAKAFPEHEIIAINCLPIIEQYGSLHCLTMQLPKGYFN